MDYFYDIIHLWIHGGTWIFKIPYLDSINLFCNLRLRNPPPWSFEISTSQGYLTTHVVYTNYVIVIYLLLLYCVISKELVTGYIIVTASNTKLSLYFLRILGAYKI